MYEGYEHIRDLIVKHIRNELTQEEKDELQQWVQLSGDNRQLFEELTNMPSLYEKLNNYERYEIEKDGDWERIAKKLDARVIFFRGKRWITLAAAAVVLLVAGYWLLTPHAPRPTKPEVTHQQTIKNDIEPGQYKAMLTLSNGQKIILDSAAQGQLARQGSTVIHNKDGRLVYDASKASSGEVVYNMLTTARGQMYATVLADGSKVWLNSASSIRYPVVFTGAARIVEITGEAYFEVASVRNEKGKVPFIVKIRSAQNEDRGQIDVLGTHFNINAYDDEEVIKTTLLEGRVNVALPAINAKSPGVQLKPGQQAIITNTSSVITTNDSPDLEAVMAWKEGRFYFDGADITTVMRQLERWYNIDVEYQGAKPTQLFGGKMERSLNLSQILRALEYTGVKFKLEGRKLIVNP